VGCRWCDTKYSWDPDGGRAAESDDLWDEGLALGPSPLLVVTGGEPLEHPGIAALLEQALARWPRVEVETSGIVVPPLSHERLAYNVSPKLPSATPRWDETWRHVAAWVDEPRATFKVVVGDPPDADDVVRLLERYRVPRERVMLMPEGLSDEAIRAHARDLAELCKREGVRMSPRLHVWMWGARRGI
jgi:7-carboxy-7-deazaguanine synthase